MIGGIGVLIWLPARARTHPDDIDIVAHDPEAVAEDRARTELGTACTQLWLSRAAWRV